MERITGRYCRVHLGLKALIHRICYQANVMLPITEQEHLKYVLMTDTINNNIATGLTGLYQRLYMVDDPGNTGSVLIH